jgi:hypothetical protein
LKLAREAWNGTLGPVTTVPGAGDATVTRAPVWASIIAALEPEPDMPDCELGIVDCELEVPDCEEATALVWWVVCDAWLVLLPPQPAIAAARPSGKPAITRLDNILPP